MGQATVDLPDPLEPPPTSAASTDDLLAQLAGEEIDRLLAEADTDQPAALKFPPVAPIDFSHVPEEAPVVTALPARLAPSPGVVAAAEAAAPAATVAQQLDTLLEQIAAPEPSKPDTLVDAAIIAATDKAPAGEEPVDAILLAEMDADAKQRASAGSAPASRASDEMSESRPLPVFLRPLEWFSAPLDSCAPSVRDTIGKVAIMTTVNALAVLAYLFIFRRH